MNQAEASAAIFKRWMDAWPTPSGATPYSLDNVGAGTVLPRAAVNLVSLDSNQYTLGPRAKMLREGMIDVRLYGELGEGRRRLDELAVVVRQVFERRSIGSNGLPTPGATRRVITHAATVNELRRDRDSGGLWMLSITVPFEFYEVVARP